RRATPRSCADGSRASAPRPAAGARCARRARPPRHSAQVPGAPRRLGARAPLAARRPDPQATAGPLGSGRAAGHRAARTPRPTLRVAVDRIQSTRSELAFVNLLAAGLGRRGATLWNPSDIADWQAAYRNYVGRYVAPHGANAIRPPVVSVDAYPFIFPHPAWG